MIRIQIEDQVVYVGGGYLNRNDLREFIRRLQIVEASILGNESTAVRKDAPFEAMHDASPNSAAAGGKTSAEAAAKLGAGTQAPPVDTVPADQSSGEGEGAAPVPPSPTGKPGDEAKPLSPAPTVYIKDRVKALHVEHPEYTMGQAANALGLSYGSVSGHSNALGIKWRPVERVAGQPRRKGLQNEVLRLHKENPGWNDAQIADQLECAEEYVRATAKRLGLTLPKHPRKAVSTIAAALATAELPPIQPASRPPIATVPSGSGSTVIAKPMQRAPRATMFRLRDDEGKYLHQSCAGMTTDKAHAWMGTSQQLLACRQKFSIARDLREYVVEKEARAA